MTAEFSKNNNRPEMTRLYLATLGWDRTSAMLDMITSECRTIEVPITYSIPHAEFLPDNKPKHVLSKYYADGGMWWPDRWVVRYLY